MSLPTGTYGSNEAETRQMLEHIGVKSLDELIDKTIPA